jgi:ABC-2 type transport system permease protein
MKHLNFIVSSLKDVYQICCDELKLIFSDSGVRILFFAAGLLYPILYGFIYKNEVLKEVPVVMVDQSATADSRSFIRKLDATRDVSVTIYANSLEEARQYVAENKAKGIVLLPVDFSTSLHAGKQAHVFAYSNIATMLYFRSIYSSINYVCLDYDEQIQVEQLSMKGLTQTQAEAVATPILSQGHPLFNPGGGFASFLLPAALILIIQQTLVIGIGMLAGTTREENTFHRLIPFQRQYHGTVRVLTGKGMAYFILYAFIGLFNLILIPHWFNLPHFLTIRTAIPFLIPFLLACIFFGMAISVFFWDRESSLLIYLCSSMPLLLLSGFSWPASNIHPFWKTIASFFPSTNGIQGYLKMNSMGASINQIAPECQGLWIQAGIYFIITFFVYRWQISQAEQKTGRV